MSKDKKKKKAKKADKGGAARKTVKNLQALSKNPMVADLVAATLVGAAAAFKDSNRARQLAANASDELQALAKEGAERGNAMWQLALEVGRRALNELVGERETPKAAPKPKKAAKAKTSKPRAARPAATARKKSATSPKTRRTPARPSR
jgi:hypothetical protein